MSEFEMTGFKMTVKSGYRDYPVQETIDWMAALEAILRPDDAILVDRHVYCENSADLNAMCKEKKAFMCSPMNAKTEWRKTLAHAAHLLTELADAGFSKRNRLVIVGGGTVMDVGGFVASIYMRGVDWLFFPTTLLAQADSCIGSKTSLNMDEYKNQIGTFWPPAGVIIDRHFLLTLPRIEVLSGIGEMLHFFMVAGGPEYEWIKRHLDVLLGSCIDVAYPRLIKAARKTLDIKRPYVEIDERDRDARRLLNFGHSFGHAIERIAPVVPHGIAVAKGMGMACGLSHDLNFLREQPCDEMIALCQKVLEAVESPVVKSGVSYAISETALMMEALTRDKKQRGAADINLILTSEPGNMFEMPVKASAVEEFLRGLVA